MKVMNKNFKVNILIGMLVFSIHTSIYAESTNSKNLGKLDYLNNCADCHGADGKGDGPKAKQLAIPPKNLTSLSKENGGSFPETVVYNIIDGRRVTDFHGQEMPIWGEHFHNKEGDEEAVEKRINDIIIYLESIQTE